MMRNASVYEFGGFSVLSFLYLLTLWPSIVICNNCAWVGYVSVKMTKIGFVGTSVRLLRFIRCFQRVTGKIPRRRCLTLPSVNYSLQSCLIPLSMTQTCRLNVNPNARVHLELYLVDRFQVYVSVVSCLCVLTRPKHLWSDLPLCSQKMPCALKFEQRLETRST
jgi:hypothetical protein